MFVRADKLLDESNNQGIHIIEYAWRGSEPLVSLYEPESGKILEMKLNTMDLVLSKKKTCVGRFEGDEYRPCPEAIQVKGFSQCRKCASVWIPIQECVFEPRCRGERCDCNFCSRGHLVYVAFIGRSIKVGMTGGGRLETRGIEQGADAIVPLVECESRLDARNMENRLAKELGLSQRIPQKSALKAIAAPADKELVVRKYHEILKKTRNFCQPLEEEISFLNDYPIRRLDNAPALASTEGTHRGELLGLKGKFAVYRESNGSIKALNLSDCVARRLITLD
ncbi:MAG TPA: DUF2797 domain-containing protein [Methanomassiliicoccales archaeon]|nr:DUF2797 domain-containing protein [Methanomassiliicoccales archaeon]